MQKIACLMREKAKSLLADKQADSVLGWQSGQFYYDNTPAWFDSPEQADNFIWNGFCGGNLSKYLIESSRKNIKTAVFFKPCEIFSLNQMFKDNRVNRQNIDVIAIDCSAGMLDINKLKANGVKGVLSIEETGGLLKVKTLYGEKEIRRADILLEKCLTCQKWESVGDDGLLPNYDRFAPVEAVEAMPAVERFAFWQSQLAKCIRCNACRNACPACSCVQCIFDNKNSGIASKANSDSFEEQMFHIIRAYHVAGRCVDCGECSRVCPQNIPLHLLNWKFIKDINEFYGEYQAGAGPDIETKAPLVAFQLDDIEPAAAKRRG